MKNFFKKNISNNELNHKIDEINLITLNTRTLIDNKSIDKQKIIFYYTKVNKYFLTLLLI